MEECRSAAPILVGEPLDGARVTPPPRPPARIDLDEADRVTASVDRLLAGVPDGAAPVRVRRWLLAVDHLLPLAGAHDRDRLLRARERVQLSEPVDDGLSIATSFAEEASAAARDGRITVALETAVRALVALGGAVRCSDRARRDPVAEAHLAARLGALCRQLFDYPRALRFYELALDAAPRHDASGAAAATAVAELLLTQVGELRPDDGQREGLLDRAEAMALRLLEPYWAPAVREVTGPRLLADVLCERGRPEQAWPLLLAVRAALHGEPGADGAAVVHLSAARCLMLLGRRAEAVGELDSAVAWLEAPADPGEPHLAELLAALRLRSAAREGVGDVHGALADARRLADLLWVRHRRQVGGFMNQVWSRAGAEEERRDLAERAEALLVTAEQDPLTGLANRRALDRFRERLGVDAQLSVVLVDVDHFKAVNDRHGHAVGDAVLQSLAGLLTRSVRTMDLVARWGGEEFLIALPGSSGRLGADAAARVCRRVRTHPWRRLADDLAVTVSAGVASGSADDLDAILARADAALYAAKRSGRDRAVVG